MLRYRAARATRAGVAAALVAGVAAAACGRSGATETEAERTGRDAPPAAVLEPADVAVVERASLSTGVVLRGTLSPHRIVELRAQVPGVVSEIRVDRGDTVQSGQILAVIEAEGVRSQAAGARAQVAAAEANLALAREELESTRMLNEAGAVSDLDLRSAEAAYEAAQGQLAVAEAEAASAGEAAGRTTITAPVDGAVSDRAASEGEAINTGDLLLTVVNSEVLELAGHIPVEQAIHVHPGQSVRFTLDAHPGEVFEGTVARVEPMADEETRQVGVYLQLPNGDDRLIGGLFATGRIVTDTVEDALLVPLAAVRERSGETFVWAIERGAVRRRPIDVGTTDSARGVVQVLAGLQEGERVLVSPGAVTDGMRVRVAAADTPRRADSPSARAAPPAAERSGRTGARVAPNPRGQAGETAEERR